ncbi:MAG: MerR family transcriptional regulator [Vampirovibrio sp.]
MNATLYTDTASQTRPYSTAQVCQLFQIQESTLKNLSQVLKLSPQVDTNDQQLYFTKADVDLLQQAIDLHRQGKPLSEIVPLLTAPNYQLQMTGSQGTSEETALEKRSTRAEELSSVVEAITHSKEFILNEMSRLLDDRLAGLDEVVVELIRTKSENDALRSKINTLSREKQQLKDEVDSFKPMQFGFYKKTKR